MRPTYANVVATLALVVAVGGSGAALAAGHLPKNSVVSKTVKNGSLQSKDILDGSITAADLAPGTLPVVPATPSVVAGPRSGPATVVAYSSDPSVTRVASVTITAPAAGFVELTGQAYFRPTTKPDYVGVELREGDVVGQAHWSAYGGDTQNYALSQSLAAVVPVSPGTHTYTLHLYESTKDAAAHSSWTGAQVIAAYFPVGSVAP